MCLQINLSRVALARFNTICITLLCSDHRYLYEKAEKCSPRCLVAGTVGNERMENAQSVNKNTHSPYF